MMIVVTKVHNFRQKQENCFIFKSSQNAMVDVSIRIVMIIALTTNH